MTAPHPIAEIVERLRLRAEKYSPYRDSHFSQCDADAMREAADALSSTEATLRRMEWQPIETAPKTGPDFKAVCILGWCPQFQPDEEPPPFEARVIWWEPKLNGGCWYGDGDFEIKPILWKPIEPPARTLADELEGRKG